MRVEAWNRDLPDGQRALPLQIAALLAELLPDNDEVHGMRALVQLQHSRRAARTDGGRAAADHGGAGPLTLAACCGAVGSAPESTTCLVPGPAFLPREGRPKPGVGPGRSRRRWEGAGARVTY